jgi:large subunit ribosomal protein L21
MFAIFESLGRQYKVSVGDVIRVDKINSPEGEAPVGTQVAFDQVLMFGSSETEAKLGKPWLLGTQVVGEVVEQGREKKGYAFKKKRRKGFKKKIGFRRAFSSVLIKDIKTA